MPDLRTAIAETLDGIKDPCSLAAGNPMGLHEMGLVRDIDISPAGDVRIALRLTSPFCLMIGFFKTEAVRQVSEIEGVASVELEADQGLDWSPDFISAAAQMRRQNHIDHMQSLPPAQ